MASANDLIGAVQAFLASKMSLESLEDISASFAATMYRDGDARSQELGGVLRAILNEFSDAEDDDALRRALTRYAGMRCLIGARGAREQRSAVLTLRLLRSVHQATSERRPSDIE